MLKSYDPGVNELKLNYQALKETYDLYYSYTDILVKRDMRTSRPYDVFMKRFYQC